MSYREQFIWQRGIQLSVHCYQQKAGGRRQGAGGKRSEGGELQFLFQPILLKVMVEKPKMDIFNFFILP